MSKILSLIHIFSGVSLGADSKVDAPKVNAQFCIRGTGRKAEVVEKMYFDRLLYFCLLYTSSCYLLAYALDLCRKSIYNLSALSCKTDRDEQNSDLLMRLYNK